MRVSGAMTTRWASRNGPRLKGFINFMTHSKMTGHILSGQKKVTHQGQAKTLANTTCSNCTRGDLSRSTLARSTAPSQELMRKLATAEAGRSNRTRFAFWASRTHDSIERVHAA